MTKKTIRDIYATSKMAAEKLTSGLDIRDEEVRKPSPAEVISRVKIISYFTSMVHTPRDKRHFSLCI